jgi:hypothetical protein
VTGPLRDRNGRLLRIRTDEERARVARKKGGFDFSWLDKKAEKRILKLHNCQFCHKNFSYLVKNHKKGFVLASCDTDGCPGNYAEKVSAWRPELKKSIGRKLDSKLMHDFKDLVIKRDPSRYFATRKGTIH